MQVKRRPQRVGLHELARLPQRLADVVACDALDPRRESELGAGTELGVHAARRPGDLEEPFARRANVE